MNHFFEHALVTEVKTCTKCGEEKMNVYLEHALKYASLGWQVFPLSPRSKEPIKGSHAVKDATTDETQIRAWWKKWPEANIAVACGAASGVYVVDVDMDSEKGINGLNSLGEFPALPETIRQDTPRGGAHFFYRTDNPPANKNNFRLGIDLRGDGYYVVLTPSIHPNGGMYAWSPGCAPWERAAAEYPEFLKQKTASNITSFKGVPIYSVPTFDTPQNDLLARAALWLAKVDPAVQGQGGHDKLFWAAQGMVNGFCLSDSQAYSLLANEFNPCCQPPWNLSNQSECKDFYRKITEARANPPRDKKIGWLLEDPLYTAMDLTLARADADALLAKLSEGNAEKESCVAVAREEEVSRLLFYESEHNFLIQPTGFLGELCSWINKTGLRYQPLLALGCSLAFLGALFGRKIKDIMGNRTNLYCMGIGGSSAGKGHAPDQIIRLCEASNCLDLIGGINITGDSAIEERLSNNPATIFFWDEISHLLADFRTGQHKALVVPTLMSIWSSAKRTYLGREYADRDKQRKIVQPCCCIWGSTTPDRFCHGITPEELRDGWLGRVLTFQTKTKPDIIEREEEPVPEHLVNKCLEWMGRGKKIINGSDLAGFVTSSFSEAPPSQIVVPLANDAKLALRTFGRESEARGSKSPEMEYLWAKAREQAQRVALIVAASEDTSNISIDASVADYACRLVRFLIEDFSKTILPEVAGSELERLKRKVVTVIEFFGKQGCQKRDLTRKTQWTGQTGRDGMLRDLIEAGEVVCEKDGKTIRFWTPADFLRKT